MSHKVNNTIVNGGTARTSSGIVGRVMTNFVTAIDNDHIVILVTANGERIRDYFYADEVTMN